MSKVVVKKCTRVDGACVEDGISVFFNDKEIGIYSDINKVMLSDVLEKIGIELDFQHEEES